MSELIRLLLLEQSQLEAEIRNDPRLLKLAKVKEMLALYGYKAAPVVSVESDEHSAAEVSKVEPDTEKGSKAAKVRAEVRALLSAQGNAHRAFILERLKSTGLMGMEKDPMASLAAYLSSWKDEFAPDGRGNFTLRPRDASEPLPATDTGAGSADGRNPGSHPGLPFNHQLHA